MSRGDRYGIPEARPLRSDAAENRERVLAAAVTAVLRDGANVPLSKIAAEAKVGVGTLYRRYPDRAALFAALEVRAFGIVIAALHEVEAMDEPGLALIERFLHRTSTRGASLQRRQRAQLRREIHEAHRLIDGIHRRFPQTAG